jgi:NADPH-dependent ferric siderophore reductase
VPTTPHVSSIELAARLDSNARVCHLVSTQALSSSIHEVVLAGQAALLCGVPGNDVMVQLTNSAGKLVRRRYSVHGVDEELDQFTLWITTAHDGPGSQWARSAQPGDEVDIVGPRGKIVLDSGADWHLFVGDITSLGSVYRMAQGIEAPGTAVFIIETDHPDDALTATFDEGIAVTGIFVDRMGRSKDDPAGLLSGLSAFAFPPDRGHAYLFGEFHVEKALRTALLDRGLEDEGVSMKAFWRVGRNNQDHGEPEKGDD